MIEYFLGSMITLVVVVVINRTIRKTINLSRPNGQLIQYSQSYLYSLLKPFIPGSGYGFRPIKESQSLKYQKELYVKIMVVENQAYWIRENALFVADFVEGELIKESSKKVDTMDMDKVQLEKMIFIVEQLTEGGPNDYGSSRKS